MGIKRNEILKVQYVNNWLPFRGKKKKNGAQLTVA